MATIYHNPRCSKSRQTLEILRAQGIEPNVALYLEDRLDKERLLDLLRMLGLSAGQLIRRSEQAFKDNHLNASDTTDEQLIEAMLKYPKLIERPIVVVGDKAVLGRPPENVMELL